MLILGCGNFDRSDDAAGLLAVRKLRELGIDAREHAAEPLALIEAWGGADEVLLIDAMISGAALGTVSVWEAETAPAFAGGFRCSTHNIGLAEAIELARVLGCLPRRLTVYGIEGARFDRGGEVSRAVAAAAEQVAEEIAARVAAHAGK